MTCPEFSLSLQRFSRLRPFVSMSAIKSPLGQYTSLMLSALTWSLIKSYFISICFDRPWNWRLLVITIVDWLCLSMVICGFSEIVSSEISWFSQRDSCAAADRAIDSASAMDKVTHDYFFTSPGYNPTIQLEDVPRGRLSIINVSSPVRIRVSN